MIDIGQRIADPWGNDAEDFAVPRFLHATAKLTRGIVEETENDPLQGSEDVRHIHALRRDTTLTSYGTPPLHPMGPTQSPPQPLRM